MKVRRALMLGQRAAHRTTILSNGSRIAALGSFALALSLSPRASADGGASSVLVQNQALFPGQGLVSDSCYYHLDMQTDGNLVEYQGVGNAPAQALWSSLAAYSGGFHLPGTGTPTTGPDPNAFSILQTDGNFVVYPNPVLSGALWATGTVTTALDEFWIRNNGDMAVYAGGSALWDTQFSPSTPGPSPCPLTSHVTQLLPNSNLPGHDLWGGCTNEPMQCGQWCAGNAACLAWTWTPPGASGSCSANEGQCWLKDAQGTVTYAPGMTSGVIQSFTPGIGNVTPGLAAWPPQSQIIGLGSGLCLDVVNKGTTAGSRVQVQTCDGTASQEWTLNATGELQQTQSGLCLNVIQGATFPGARLQLWDCTGTSNEIWNLSANGELEGAGSGLCLNVAGGATVPGTDVQIWSCAGTTPNEVWRAQTTSELQGQGSGLCLNVAGGATTAGTPVQIWSCDGSTPNEVWTLNAQQELVGQGSGLCLDVSGGGTSEGTPVGIWYCTGNPNQQWRWTAQGELQGVGSGMCLDVDGGSTAPGTRLQIWPCHGTPNQVWSVPPPPSVGCSDPTCF